jgi:hypothetical protein
LITWSLAIQQLLEKKMSVETYAIIRATIEEKGSCSRQDLTPHMGNDRIQREVGRLEKAKMIATQTQGRKRFFTLPGQPPPQHKPEGTQSMTDKIVQLHKGPLQEQADQALRWVELWNQRFPRTTRGANQLTDQSALLEMIEDGVTDKEYGELLTYIETHRLTKYYYRPNRLMKPVGGAGPYTYIHLQMQIEDENTRAVEKHTNKDEAELVYHFAANSQ